MKFKTLQPYFVVFSASLFFLFEFINMNSFNVLNDDLRSAFQVNALQISNLSAMYFYANVIFLIPAGLLLDRFSTKKLLLIALFLCILSNFIFASTHQFALAEICRFITGMGSTLCLLSTALLTARWFPPKKAGLIMGFVITMAMLGGMLAQQLTFLLHLVSWRIALSLVAFIGLVFFALIFLFVQDYPQKDQAKIQAGSHLLQGHFVQNFLAVFKNKQVWKAGLYTSFVNLTVMILGALWGQEYLVCAQNVSDSQASFIISMIFIGLIIGSPLFGYLSDRIGRRKLPMLIGGLANLVCIALILYLPLSFHALVALFFLLGLFSASQIISYPLIMESCPPHIIASSEALSATLIMGGGAIFQPLFGYMLDHMAEQGVYTIQSFQHAMLILPLAFCVAIVLAACIKETHCQAYTQEKP